jgi:hypothetical protein
MKPTLLCLTLLATAASSHAGIIFMTNIDNGTALAINDLTGLVTTGDLMAGMQVSGLFSNGSTQTCTWVVTGAGSGGCTAGNAADGSFSLNQAGDSFTNPFQLANLSTQALLLVLTINGAPGNTVFDIVSTPGLTPGSDFGLAVSGFTSTGAPNGLGTYSNIVNVNPDAAQGDLYAQLGIDFGAGLAPGLAATFLADTDSIGLRGGLPGSTADPNGVPEPMTVLLCGVSLIAIGLIRRFPDELL